MRKRRLRGPSPALVVACIALAVALSGVGYAAVALPRNSVGTPQLKRNAVKSPKVAANTLNGGDINEATLGTVPSANAANTAANATNATNATNAANADRLDNLDSTAFSQAGHNHDDRYFTETEADARYVRTTDETVFAYGQIREDASIRNGSSRLLSPVGHPATGIYCLRFSPQPSQLRLEGSVVGLSGSGNGTLFARVSNGQGGDCPAAEGGQGALNVRIVNAAGTLTDGRFTFIVP
jgi:hypothetical protein